MPRRSLLLLVGLCLAAFTPSPGADDDPRKASRADLDALQGTWTLVALQRHGEDLPPEEVGRAEAIYQADTFTQKQNDRIRRRGLVILDASRTPKAINTWDLDGPYADHTVPGIYELKGEILRLCFAQPGDERPTKFTTKEGTGTILATYKRKPR